MPPPSSLKPTAQPYYVLVEGLVDSISGWILRLGTLGKNTFVHFEKEKLKFFTIIALTTC